MLIFLLPDAPPAQDKKGNSISWTSTLDQTIPNLPDDGREKQSLKRLKHLHREKVHSRKKPSLSKNTNGLCDYFLTLFGFQVNRLRAQHRINVHGSDVPDPVSSFEELQTEYGLNPRVVQNLKEAGLDSPTAVQMQAIPLMMHVSHISRQHCSVG